MFRTRELNDVREEIKELSQLNPNEKYRTKGIDQLKTGKTKPKFDEDGKLIDTNTVGDRLKYLESRETKLNQLIGYDLLQQNEYQQKLKDLKVPSAFGKTISDPDLTIDEWQGMLSRS